MLWGIAGIFGKIERPQALSGQSLRAGQDWGSLKRVRGRKTMKIGKKVYKTNLAEKTVSVGAVFCLLLGMLFFSEGGSGKETPQAPADFFAYTDSKNRLYLWKEGAAEPLLLTDTAFACQEKTEEIPYWESWEYWEEWDEANNRWIRNEKKALQKTVWETPGQTFYFPGNMRWMHLRMRRGEKEREEALAYTAPEELEEWAGVRVFAYDLYRWQGGGHPEKERLAENVLFYSVDEKGAVWYCKASPEETLGAGEEMSRVRCMLYRYDGTGHMEIGEINGRLEEPYRVLKGGAYVIFYGMDDSLYGCAPGKAAQLLAERVDDVLYRDDAAGKMLFTRDGTVYILQEGKEQELLAGASDEIYAGALGEEGDRFFMLDAAEDARYADWIEFDAKGDDADAQKLWELLGDARMQYYPLLMEVKVIGYTGSLAETVEETKGYVVTGPSVDEAGTARDVYYMEMMPADTFEKIPLSELLGDSLPGDVLYAYAYYLDNYGEDYAQQALAWALEECWEREAIESRTRAYALTQNGIHPLETLKPGMVFGSGEEYSADGKLLYLMQYQSPGMEKDYRSYGHHFYYGYLENRYALDKDGGCQKVVELADGTAVLGNEVFYCRNKGLEGYVSLYRTGAEEPVAAAADISMDSLVRSVDSDAVLLLAEGLLTAGGEEQIPVRMQSELREAYAGLGLERSAFAKEEELHTLVLCQNGKAQELEKNIYEYDFYGTDSVWMLQYAPEDLGETDYESGTQNGRIGRLFVRENGEIRQITDQAVWMAGAGDQKSGGRASWVFD